MSSQRGFRVPYTVCEWNRVRMLYRSENISELEECLDLLCMWRSRMGDSTPVAISCSDLFIRVAIEEQKVKTDHISKTESLKLLHCITIIRFINYINEINQPHDGRSISIVNSVKKLGIPRWLVEIRHNASHSHVPPIETLRKAYTFSFNWLWKNFWAQPADEAIRQAGVIAQFGDSARDLYAKHTEARMNYTIEEFIRWRNMNPVCSSSEVDRYPPVAIVRRRILQEPHAFLRSFVSLLALNPEQSRTAGFLPVVPEKDWKIPAILHIFWEPVFSMLHENNLLSELAIAIISAIPTATPYFKSQYVSWARVILEPLAQPDVNVISPYDWNRILQKMVAATDSFSTQLLELVMSRIPNMSPKRRRQVLRIMDISLSESLMEIDDSMSVRTVEHLQKMLKKDARGPDIVGRFRVCENEEWQGVPIGLIPGQTYDTFSLVLDDDWIRTRDENMTRKRGLTSIPEDSE